MMKKQRFLVYTEYIFDGVFDVVAESKEEARQKAWEKEQAAQKKTAKTKNHELEV